MAYQVRFLDPANVDLQEIKDYLDREAAREVRKAFVLQLFQQLETAKNFPESNAVYLGCPAYRRMVIKNFPYCLFYKIDQENKMINIYRVLHTARDISRLISGSDLLCSDGNI